MITDDRLENLEYVTKSENGLHANRIGLRSPQQGSKHGMSKLTETIVQEIRTFTRYITNKELAKVYNVSSSTISSVRHGNSWRHV